MRTAFFIDGYNLFYGLLAGTGYKWLDLPSLLSSVARIENPAFEPISFHYFTSPVQPKLSTRGIQSKEAQDTYIRALKAKGVEVILGRHRLDPAKAPRFVDRNTPPSRQNQVDIGCSITTHTGFDVISSFLSCKITSFRLEFPQIKNPLQNLFVGNNRGGSMALLIKRMIGVLITRFVILLSLQRIRMRTVAYMEQRNQHGKPKQLLTTFRACILWKN